MPRARAAAAIVFILIGGCSLPQEQSNRPVAGPDRRYDELVVLIPKANGQAGAVVVRHQGRQYLLNRPYQSARLRPSGSIETDTLHASAIERDFGNTLAALPPRPKTYIVYFVEGKDELTDASIAQFESILAEAIREELASRPVPELSVVGHTDSVGSERFNDQLSLARAQRVVDELMRRGIPRARIVSIAGLGLRDPLVVTGPGVPEPRNRRVEIRVR